MNSSEKHFGQLVLLVGDFHVPTQTSCFPEKFKELLNTDKISHVLCTGNLGSKEIYQLVSRLAPNVHIVRGDMDVELPDYPEPASFPEQIVVDIAGIRIGLIHGHQITPLGCPEGLTRWQRSVNCDIVVSGYTHQRRAEKIDGKVYINPGSCTGARSLFSTNMQPPTFMLMSISQEDSSVQLYVYEIVHGEIHTSSTEFSRTEQN